MTDKEKLEAIRAEVYRRYVHHGTFEGVIAETREDECSIILDIIDSMQENPCDGCTNRKGCVTCENGELRETMQEEPKHKFVVGNKIIYLNEEYEIVNITDHYILHTTKRTKIKVLHLAFDNEEFMELVEEPVSKDLEEAAKRYADNENPTCNCWECLFKSFKAGAQWKKEQDKETIELAEDHAMLAGMEKMKEQMMAKAVDGEIGYWNIRGLSVNMDLPRTLEEGDKVKLIIIKEG